MTATLLGKPIAEIFSRFTVEGLLWLLSNESDDFGVVVRRDGHVYQKRPTRLFKGRAIKAAVATMSGRQQPSGRLTFVPSCQKGFIKKSCCGGLRIPPAPEGKTGVIPDHVRRTLTCLRAYAYGRSVIAEACGDGAYQFWAIRNGFSAHKTWRNLLEKVGSAAGIACQIFPSEDGLGMPAPGSWDPHSGRLSRILFADLAAIFPGHVYSAFDSAAGPISGSTDVAPNAKS